MNRLLMLLAALLFATVLVACGGNSEETPSNESDENSEETEDTEGNASDSNDEEENEEQENKVGDTVTNEAGESLLVSRTDDVGTFESGPIKLTIEKANGVSMKINDDYVDMLGGKELEYIQVDMTVENTSDDHISFYASQATMTTSTGEQLESDMLMSDHIDGEFLGAVTKSGSSFYFLENSKAEDVESIKLFYSAPHDENFEDIGDKIEVEIPLNK